MAMMMDRKLEILMNTAIREANKLKHEYLTLEGVLYAMIADDRRIRSILEHCGGNVEEIEAELRSYICNEKNFSVLNFRQMEELGKKQFSDEGIRQMAKDSGIHYRPEISLPLHRVIQRAAIHVQSEGRRDIQSYNILISMFQEKESHAVHLLRKHGIERPHVVEAISCGIDQTSDDEEAGLEGFYEEEVPPPSKGDALEQFTLNLNSEVKKGAIDPLIGREEELERMICILCRRKKHNPLLVGEAGVGKTAIVEGLARKIVEGQVPDVLRETTIFSLDMASLVAGAKFRGDFEYRFKSLLKILEKKNASDEMAILFIDELHMAIGAGSVVGGQMDVSNMLRDVLTSGPLRCIGSTTHNEYRRYIEKEGPFNRRFQKIDVCPPSVEETYRILLGLKGRFETHHKVKYSRRVLRLAVELSDKYILDRMNPDKSIDVIDEAGAAMQLIPKKERHSSITRRDVEEVVAKSASLPSLSVASGEREQLKNLKDNLKLLLYGQDHAIDQVVDCLILSRSGLREERRPMGSFLFCGPTGVGKTELARQLAFHLGLHLERIDMSEYMEKHTVARLIGAPPGYVGHDRGGILTDSVRKHPHCVVLMDEIEKAHRDVYNILLQVMDDATLTDAQGRKSDFRNTLLIMTTNQGTRESQGPPMGLLLDQKAGENQRNRAIERFFSPEFRNRPDGIIHFRELGEDQIREIVEKHLSDLEAKLAKKNLELEVSFAAKTWLAKKGHTQALGARPLARVIDEKIKGPLSRYILFGNLARGTKVRIDLKVHGSRGEEKLIFGRESRRTRRHESLFEAQSI